MVRCSLSRGFYVSLSRCSRWLLFAVHCALLVARCARCALCVVLCALFVVRRSLFAKFETRNETCKFRFNIKKLKIPPHMTSRSCRSFETPRKPSAFRRASFQAIASFRHHFSRPLRARAPKLTMSHGFTLLTGCLALPFLSHLGFSFSVIRAFPGRAILINSAQQKQQPTPTTQQLMVSATRVNNDGGGGAFVRPSRHISIHPPLLLLRPPVDPATAASSSSSRSSSCRMSTTSSLLSEGVGASPRWEGFWSGGVKKGDMWDTGTVSPALQQLLDQGMIRIAKHWCIDTQQYEYS